MPLDLQNSPGFLIDRIAHLARLKVKRKIAEMGLDLTTEETAILAALMREDGLRIGDLAGLLVRDTTTVTRQVEGLERKGCIKREVATDDRRVVRVKLLKEGIRLYQIFDPVLTEFKSDVFAGIPDHDQKVLVKSLRQLKINLLEL